MLLDVERRDIQSFLVHEIEDARERIGSFDIVGAVDVRPMLRSLGVDAGDRRLAELGPPQKTKTLNGGGWTLKITEAMLIQGPCGIARPFGDGEKLETYPTPAGSRCQVPIRLLSVWALARRGPFAMGLPRRNDPGAVGPS